MKSTTALWWASTFTQAYSASSEAYVYFGGSSSNDREPPSATTPSISPSEARLLFAQRLGLSSYHSLGDASDSTLELLNGYGGPQRQLFDNEHSREQPNRLLAIIEGFDLPEDLIDGAPVFKIFEPPSSTENLQLVSGFVAQARDRQDSERFAGRSGRQSDVCQYDFQKESKIGGGILGGHFDDGTCGQESLHIQIDGQQKSSAELPELLRVYGSRTSKRTAILQISTLESFTRRSGTAYTEAHKDLRDTMAQLLALPNYQQIDLVLMPRSSKANKRSSYGAYTTPKNLARRAHNPTEEPLTSLPASVPSRPSQPQTLASNASAPIAFTSVLPVCHSSLESAIAATNNCSGHGTAYEKYTTQLGEDKEISCFACKCTKTVTKDSEGRKKTINWGGPACQKKDISAQFWLLAGLGIGLAATVSWGIGLLFSIGEEELPSVIGAGVAGPRAQK